MTGCGDTEEKGCMKITPLPVRCRCSRVVGEGDQCALELAVGGAEMTPGLKSSLGGGHSVLSPYDMLGSVLRAVAATGNKKGHVCPRGVYGLPTGTDTA